MNFDSHDGLEKHCRRNRMFQPVSKKVDIGRQEIAALLPHSGPMLLLDKITALDMENLLIEGERTLIKSDSSFEGHFPGFPIYPGVLQIEMCAQLGLCLFFKMLHSEKFNNAAVRLWKVHRSVFCAEAYPGDNLKLLAMVLEDNGVTMTCAGQILRNSTIISFSIVEAVLVDQE